MTGTDLNGAAAPLITGLARFGFAVKGIVTILIGALALRFALGWGGDITGPQGAIEALLDEPFGRINLAVLSLGLASYALWMLVEAFMDPEQKGTGFQGVAERIAFFVTAVGFGLLTWATLKLLLGAGGGGGADLDDLAATLLTPRVGRWLVGTIGVIVMVAGLLQLRLGVTRGFRRILRGDMSTVARTAVVTSGTIGYVALGILSLLVGYFLLEVAIRYDPSRAGGWDEALTLVADVGEGRRLLGMVAAGLIFYGFYFVFLMRYRTL